MIQSYSYYFKYVQSSVSNRVILELNFHSLETLESKSIFFFYSLST